MQSRVHAFLTDLNSFRLLRSLETLLQYHSGASAKYMTLHRRQPQEKCFIRPFVVLTFASLMVFVI